MKTQLINFTPSILLIAHFLLFLIPWDFVSIFHFKLLSLYILIDKKFQRSKPTRYWFLIHIDIRSTYIPRKNLCCLSVIHWADNFLIGWFLLSQTCSSLQKCWIFNWINNIKWLCFYLVIITLLMMMTLAVRSPTWNCGTFHFLRKIRTFNVWEHLSSIFISLIIITRWADFIKVLQQSLFLHFLGINL